MTEMQPLALCRAFCTPEVKAVNKARREITHLITTNTLDRAGDVVEPGGAQVDNYLKNPVVMADHDYSIDKIIGRASKLEITDAGITATTQFHDKGLGADAFNLVADGMARAFSIGFRPVEHESIKDDKGHHKGFRFKQWELLEYSLVAIPANPDAVMAMVQRGLVGEDNINKLFRSEVDVMPRSESGAPSEAKAGSPSSSSHPHVYDLLMGYSGKVARQDVARRLRARMHEHDRGKEGHPRR